VFGDAPILMDRDEEEPADSVHAVAITGAPIVTTFNRTQEKTFLRMKLRLVAGSDMDKLRSLMKGSTPVTVKLTPGSATTILCRFAGRDEQTMNPYNDDFATGKPDGTAVDPIYTQFSPELLLLRL
jgi:hypothetical protein